MEMKHDQTIQLKDVTLPAGHWFSRLPVIGVILSLIGFLISFVAAKDHSEDFFFSFHVSYLYFLSIALGGLFFVLVQFATRAGWSVLLRRFAENIMGTLPLFALLFIPMIFGMHSLFHHWTDVAAVQLDPVLKAKQPYLNETFFYIRAAIYFVAWTVLARFFLKGSVSQDSSGDVLMTRKLQARSYPSIAIFALTLTFAGIDWIMSLDPHWFSTIFGVYYFAGSVVAIYAVLVVIGESLKNAGTIGSLITTEHKHDLGKLLFAHTVFWTYIAFSQFFLMWYANLPEETIWYGHRFHGDWLAVSIFLAIGHFAVPFFFILSRHVKRNRWALTTAAVWMLFMHFVDIYWLIMPNHRKEDALPTAVDLGTFLAIAGLFVAVFGYLTKRSALVPLRDPRLAESLSFENL
jgi:hypothetical protein